MRFPAPPVVRLIRPQRSRVDQTVASSPFASRSLRRHYLRGLVGLLAFAAAFAGAAAGASAALALLLVSLAAWRGCPTCWTIGLIHTRACETCSAAARH